MKMGVNMAVSGVNNLQGKPPVFGRQNAPRFTPHEIKSQAKGDTVFFGNQSKPDYFIRTPAYPWLLDDAGYVKAGHVLKLIDIAGSKPAFQHLYENMGYGQGAVVTASVDRTDFRAPIRRWDMITLECRKTQVWDKSMETQVNVFVENFRKGKPEKTEVATSHLVFVGINPATRETIKLPAYTPKTREEKELARAADIRKSNRKKEGQVAPFLPIEDADTPFVITRKMTNDDANMLNNVFGGIILDILEEAGRGAAKRHVMDGTPVNVRMDRMSFVAPTFVGETVEAKAIVTKSWNTSMEVQVEVEAVHPETNTRRQVATAYMVYVKLMGEDRNGSPELSQVPPWKPATEKQQLRADAAQTRRTFRKEEQAEFEQSRLAAAMPKKPGLLARLIDWVVSWLERVRARLS